MVKIVVKKLRGFPKVYDAFAIDSSELGESWCSFFLKTDFCRILPWRRLINHTSRLGYNGFVYVVRAGNREIVYNSNFELDHGRYIFVKILLSTFLININTKD